MYNQFSQLDVSTDESFSDWYAFDTYYPLLKEYTMTYGTSDVPTDHYLYPFACQVRESFFEKFRDGKTHTWAKVPKNEGDITMDQFLLLGLLNFVWTKPPHNWREMPFGQNNPQQG